MSLQGEFTFEYDLLRRTAVEILPVNEQITSDAGLLPIRDLDERLGWTAGFAARMHDSRVAPLHTVVEMVRQHVFGILAGYEDQNDASEANRPAGGKGTLRPRAGKEKIERRYYITRREMLRPRGARSLGHREELPLEPGYDISPRRLPHPRSPPARELRVVKSLPALTTETTSQQKQRHRQTPRLRVERQLLAQVPTGSTT
jgi:hypothetical protein